MWVGFVLVKGERFVLRTNVPLIARDKGAMDGAPAPGARRLVRVDEEPTSQRRDVGHPDLWLREKQILRFAKDDKGDLDGDG
jgi:hypothetical protein